MYRYYQQTSDTDPWKIALDNEPHNPWAFAKKYDAARVSILALSNDPDIAPSVGYQGPMFFDIDFDGEAGLTKALESGNELVSKLLHLGVSETDIEIHLSGKKGVHVFVPQETFAKAPVKDDEQLAAIYKKLALTLFVPGLDMQVYSGGKGRLVRPPDSKRPDGRYKVQVSISELREMTTERYKDLTSKPRGIPFGAGSRVHAAPLGKLFAEAKQQIKKSTGEISEGLDDLSIFGDSIPPCVQMLVDGKKANNVTFNQIALNIACWSARSSIDSELLGSLHSAVAEAIPSSSGGTSRSQKNKLQAMHNYVVATKDKYKFSCGAMLKVTKSRPCSECQLKTVPGTGNPGILESLYMHTKNGQWYADSDCTQLVSTFTMERDSVIVSEENTVLYSSVTLRIPSLGRSFSVGNFLEKAWNSKAAFKDELTGIDGAAFMGTDNDVTRIKLTVERNELLTGLDMNEKRLIEKVGISYRRRSGPDNPTAEGHTGRFIYSEPDWTINDSAITNTHIFVGDAQAAPDYGLLDPNDPISDGANECFALLLKCNLPSVVAPILGWYLFAHIKTHVYQIEHRGPLLCVSGVAGTGKNSFTGVMQRLAGLKGESALFTLEAPNSTKLPFQQALSNSTTIPRVINELNPKSVGRNQYRDVTELLKGAFDSQNIVKGRLGGGDRSGRGANVSSVSWKITAPVVTLSEEPINIPAVMQRAIMVDMTPAGHDYGARAFKQLEYRADELVEIGKTLMYAALSTSVRDIDARLKATKLPPEVHSANLMSRVEFGYRVILMAYDWACDVLSDPATGFSAENLTNLKAMRGKLENHLSGAASRLSRESSITEVDRVLRDMAVMAYSSGDMKANYALEKGKHFVVVDDILYLDLIIAYPLYVRFKNGSPEGVSIRSAEAFMTVVRSMRYFISDLALTDLLPTGGRPVLGLSIAKMQDANIPVQMFI